MTVWKFNKESTVEQPQITEQQLVDLMLAGDRFAFGVDNLLQNGVYRQAGYAFEIRNRLHCYVYRQFGGWHEAYAPNRTSLRKLIGGRIDEILESNKF
jgi:hypothetical protein